MATPSRPRPRCVPRLGVILGRHAARPPGAHGSARDATTPRSVRAARDLLHARLADPPSLEELASAVGSGTFALLRAFRAAYGLPPHAYLTNLRVQRAREMLDTGLRPAEVAARAGFTDQAHLNRHFKRIVGVPPGAYLLGRVRQTPVRPRDVSPRCRSPVSTRPTPSSALRRAAWTPFATDAGCQTRPRTRLTDGGAISSKTARCGGF